MSTTPENPRPGARPAASSNHISTRLSATTVARVDALVPAVTAPGTKPSRSVAVRACILTGLDALEAQHTMSRGAL